MALTGMKTPSQQVKRPKTTTRTREGRRPAAGTAEAENARLVVAGPAREKRPGLEVPLEDELRPGAGVLPYLEVRPLERPHVQAI